MTATVLDLDATTNEDLQPACDNEDCERPASYAVTLACSCLSLLCHPCLEEFRRQIRAMAEQFETVTLICERHDWRLRGVPADRVLEAMIRSVEAL